MEKKSIIQKVVRFHYFNIFLISCIFSLTYLFSVNFNIEYKFIFYIAPIWWVLYTCGISTHHWRAFRKVFWLGLSLSRVTMWNRVNYEMGLIEKGIYRSLGPYKFCFFFSLVKTYGDYVEHIWSRILITRRFLCLCVCLFPEFVLYFEAAHSH